MTARPAVMLTSGGVDSVTTAYYVKKRLRAPRMILVFANYKQRTYDFERFCIEAVGRDLACPVKLIDLSWLGDLSTSLLTKKEVPIPETKEGDLWDPKKAEQRILKWWDVVRNLELVTVGLAHAESVDLNSYLSKGKREVWDVYIGIRRETPVAMKDNTPAFLKLMDRVAEQSTHFGGYHVKAPLIAHDKDMVVKLGEKLGVPWEYTYSCYAGGGFRRVGGRLLPVHCGTCSNCKRRKLAFSQARVRDPSVYHQ
ncbi:MAG TPA: 7-cyano-7-deazaguanine synthase [Nitrososphaerales archaeon]|nr:7-cyano-7-deazaguanine synthase [Nitrososphaerales archaeon]